MNRIQVLSLLYLVLFTGLLSCKNWSTNPEDSSDHFPQIVLQDTTNQADFLVIAPLQFYDSLITYQSWRNSQGLHTDIIPTEFIDEVYGDSLSLKVAIHRFLWFTYRHWQTPAPRYVLLVGTAELLPTFLYSSNLPAIFDEGQFESDWPYGMPDPDSLQYSVFAIGRWPCSTAQEVGRLVRKTQQYEAGSSYRNFGVLVADSGFGRAAQNFANEISPNQFKGYSVYPDEDNYLSSDSLVALINQGLGFIGMFTPESPTTEWGNPPYFGMEQLAQLTNYSKPWVGFSTTQLSMSLSDSRSFTEELVVNRAGAVAIVANSGVSFLAPTFQLFNQILTENSYSRLGERLRAGLSNRIEFKNNVKFVLLGDPVLLMPILP